ncbi:MAG: DUF1906 domain-containing protein [Sporichthyaceae bacterium]
MRLVFGHHLLRAQPRRTQRLRRLAGSCLTVGALLATSVVLLAGKAQAGPTDAVRYPAGASSTRFSGLAFDVCDAPTTATMAAWRESPYRAIGIYISGEHRACEQRNLTADWVRAVSLQGWKLIPLDVGKQAPCADNRRLRGFSRDPATARSQGRRAGAESVAAARSLGIAPGRALYSDIESFRLADIECAHAVRSYLSGWTGALHQEGYLAGAYGNLHSLVRDLSSTHGAPDYLRLDAIWSAQWDRSPNLSGWSGVPDEHWPLGQRIKQFVGDHRETHGGRTLLIDSNIVNAPVATVAWAHLVATAFPASTTSAPSVTSAITGSLPPQTRVEVICRLLTTTGTWHKLVGGSYVPGAALASVGGTPAIPPCTVAFQVRPRAAFHRLSADATSPIVRRIPAGTLIWIDCERAGMTRGRPGYWGRLGGAGWMSGAILARPEPFGRTAAVPACNS